MKSKNTRYIPFKNYIAISLILICSVLITLYVFKWYQVKTNEKISYNYLIKNNYVLHEITSIAELEEILNESPSHLYLYITYRNDKDIYNLEKGYVDTLKKYNIQDSFYLFDITTLKKSNSDYKKIINDKLDIDVNGYPALVYYEDGQIVSYKKINKIKDFNSIVKKYN